MPNTRRKKHMRLPNGFGSIVFLRGNRRKPYYAKKFREWNDKGYPQYDTVGFYETYNEAYAALLEYNQNPYDLSNHNMTFKEASDRWFKEYVQYPVNGRLPSKQTVYGYRIEAAKCEPIYDRNIREITASELQAMISTVSAGSQHAFKAYLSHVFKWAAKNNVITDSPVKYIYRTEQTDPKRNPFTVEEVRRIWAMPPCPVRDTTLILLYTGMRIGELFTISEKTDRYIVAGEKTEAGKNRIIPIHHEIKSLIDSAPMYDSTNQYRREFIAVFPAHRPHDCRRTFVTRSVECGMDQVVSRKIVGHTGSDVHETVYVKLNDIDFLCEQMELIHY